MISERLYYLRKKHALSQKELASKLNLGESTIAMWETNKRFPDAQKLTLLADFFGCTVDFILGRTNDEKLVKIEGAKLPYELQGKIDAITIVEDCLKQGISPETIQELLMFYNKITKKQT